MSPTATISDPLNPETQEFVNNPYPVFDRLRNDAPVWWSAKSKYWIVSRYAEARAILRDLDYEKGFHRFKQGPAIADLFPQVRAIKKAASSWMLQMDPPDHTRIRSLVNKAFTPKIVSEMHPDIESIANSLLDDVQKKGEMDVMQDFAFPLPVMVISDMLGVPRSDRDKFKHWSDGLVGALNPRREFIKVTRAGSAVEELNQYLMPLVEERRKNPKNDLISLLVQAEEEGNKLTREEVLSNCILLLVAGHETTVNLIGNSVLSLLHHPEQLDLLKKQPELTESAVEEVLRFESPVQTVRRVAGDDLELAGNKLKKEDFIMIFLGSANRDPEQFENADKFDITRKENKHLAFSEGIHYCLGASLARTEGRVAIQQLFNRLPNLKLASDKIEFKMPFALRGPRVLPVKW
jgi:pimeloyl-[acyl-carrier protein] synthase